MSWSTYHANSEKYAAGAEAAIRKRDHESARRYYRLAAVQESLALDAIAQGKSRTFGITAVSATSLWLKGAMYGEAQGIAYKALASPHLPEFASEQLKGLLQLIWNEEALAQSGISFVTGEVLISVSGGDVVKGAAPLELILHKVDEVRRIFYRTVEYTLSAPFRRRGAPSLDIQERFRPWLLQAPAGSYQFAVRVEKPLQMPLFPEDDRSPSVDEITAKFMQIISASVDDSDRALASLVADTQYREVFLKLTRNLAPTGKTFAKLEIRASEDIHVPPIVLVPESRQVINQALKSPELQPPKTEGSSEHQIEGILRGLHLDNDWIEVNTLGEHPETHKIYDADDAIDDVIGPMVNRKVIVTVIRSSKGRLQYKDMQADD